MSDLCKAIRAELETNYWRASRANSIAADRGARAILSTLDLHTHTDVPGLPMRQCAACGLVSRDQWCDTVNAIADDLGVSGEDRSEPTPAPRQWREGDDEPTEPGLKLLGSNGVTFVRAEPGRWIALPPEGSGENLSWWHLTVAVGLTMTEVLSEAVSPEGTS